MNRLLPLLLVLSLLAACAPAAAPPDTGIEGQSLLGPMCPVVREDQPCPDAGYQATLTVLTESGDRVTQFQTDAEGHFRVALSPGVYVLHPELPEGKPFPFAAEIPFTVVEGEYTPITVSYDSGIR